MPRPSQLPQVSSSAADRAGVYIRRFLIGAEDDRARAVEAVVTISNYRSLHSYPMTKVTLGVASMIRTATRDDTLRPGQRFKRLDRIVDKLMRHRSMRLSQMEDIGGCRAVLENLEQVYAVAQRCVWRWGDRAQVTDYIDRPKEDGYRGIHIIERRDGRLVEVQLRTRGQHAWAEAVEEFGPRTGFNLKDGAGPDDLREYFRLAAERIARDEHGTPRDDTLEERFATLREQVLPYFRRT